MSRWIDADALMQKLDIKADCKECNAIDHYLCCLRSPDFVNACEAINDAPSIDIVRCSECKHNVGLTNGFWEEDIVCDYWESDGLTTDDYCSYGERKESE